MDNIFKIEVNLGDSTLQAIDDLATSIRCLAFGQAETAAKPLARKTRKTEKPAEEKPAEEKPAEEKPAEEKPAEEKPAEEKPAEGKTVSLEDITEKASGLLDADKMNELCALLGKFKCEAITELPKDRYNEFFDALCAIPA
jgi:chemotaxis protein histidine kinase CheA